jgi:hypothetical protein
MPKITKDFLLHSIELKCKDANPYEQRDFMKFVKRHKKDDLAYFLKVLKVTSDGHIQLGRKTRANKSVDSLFYDWCITCTNCGEEVTFQVPKGITGIEYSTNLVCIACGCKYDANCDFEDDDPFA